jgi:hypothetical protein
MIAFSVMLVSKMTPENAVPLLGIALGFTVWGVLITVRNWGKQ